MAKPNLVARALKGAGRFLNSAGDAFSPLGGSAPSHRGASTGSRFSGWRPRGAGPNSIVSADGPELVRRARDIDRNNPVGRKARTLTNTHIVGSGLVPRSLCPDVATREALQQLFDDWSPYCDADGLLDFYGQQSLAVDEWFVGGECFGRMRQRYVSDGLPVPLQVQSIPTEMVPLFYNGTNGANTIIQGIERNPVKVRVAYYIYREHPGDLIVNAGGDPNMYSRVDAVDVLHMLSPSRSGQMRGLPWLAAALTSLQQMGDWYDAALVRKNVLTMIVGFIKRAVSGDMDADEIVKKWGDLTEEAGIPAPAVSLEPGTIQYLDPLEEPEFLIPQDSGAADEPFIRAQMRSIAGAVDLLYEELSGDWSGTNDRTYRAAFNTFKRRARQWQQNNVAFQWCRPIWLRFCDLAVASGAIKIPAGLSDVAFKRVQWVPTRWDYLNAVQDIQSIREEIDAGVTSRDQAILERGGDPEQVDQSIKTSQDRAERLGLKLNQDMPKPPAGVNGGTDSPASEQSGAKN
jgi:lambda family phage portal protein